MKIPNLSKQVYLAQIPLSLLHTFPFLLLLLSSVTTVTYLSYETSRRSIDALADKLTAQASARVSDKISDYVKTSQQITRFNRNAIESGEIKPDDFQRLQAMFLRQIKIYPEVTALSFATNEGQFIAAVRDRDGTLSRPDQILGSEVFGKMPNVRYIYELDKKGNRGKIVHITRNFDVRDRTWYKMVVKANKEIWTPFFAVFNVPSAFIAFVAPVYKEGKFQGAIQASLYAGHIGKFLKDLNVSPQGQVFILERTGNMVGTSTSEQLFNFQANILHRLAVRNSKNLVTRSAGIALFNNRPDLKDIISRERIDFKINAQRYYAWVQPYRNNLGLDWLIVTAIPESDFMADINLNNERNLALSAITLLLAIFIGILTARAIVRPIEHLQLAATALTRGDLNYPVEESGVGEVASLASAFKEMANQLARTFQSLEASEQRFSNLLQEVPIGISVYDATGKPIFLNRIGEKILGQGMTPSDISKLSLTYKLYIAGTNLLYPAELLPVVRGLRGETASIEDVEVEVKGKRIPLEIHTIPMFDEKERVIGAITAFLDISERRENDRNRAIYERELENRVAKQKETILQNEAIYRAIVNALPDSLLRMRRDGTYLDIKFSPDMTDTSSQTITSLFSSLIEGENISSILPQEIAKKRLMAIERALVTGEIQIYELPIDHRGLTYWQEARVVPLNLDEVLVIIRDLTARKQSEQALQESEERFRQAFEEAPIGIALVNLEGKPLRVNRALCEILGYGESELLSLTIEDIIHPEDLYIDRQQLNQLIADEIRSYQVEKRFFNKNKQIIRVSVNLSLIRSGQKPFYFIIQMQDISERYQIERIKDEFISVMSHELRTPLTAIRGSLGLLNTGFYKPDSQPYAELIRVATQNSERLVRLVNDILDLERLQSGKGVLVKKPCWVQNLIKQAIESVQVLAEAEGIILVDESENREILIDQDSIIQTLTNLLGNAIKFSPPESEIYIKSSLILENEQTFFRFAIEDRGCGIPADKLTLIFDRFQQVNISDSRKKGGTGLGLAICKNIVLQHGGKIWAESVLGAGSTFYFTIPLTG